MENRNENQLSPKNAEVGLDLSGFEIDERFDVGFDRLLPGRLELNRASSDSRSLAAPGSEVVARGDPPISARPAIPPTCFGVINVRPQAEAFSALRADTPK
jgi:hypothetical protein